MRGLTALSRRRTKRAAVTRTADRRTSRHRGWRDDDGAVIVLVAILVAGGVISGLLALVADLGQLYAERRVVQNGADAAALAIAQDCAEGVDGCIGQEGADARAEQFANANAPDDVTAVTEVCGPDGEGLTACPAPGAHWADCQPVSEEMPHYVRVRTSTLRPDGGTFLLPIFAGLLAEGEDAELGTGACAQAGWGPPSTAFAQLAILVPVCPGNPNGEDVVIEDFKESDPDQDCSVTVNDVEYPYPGVTKGFGFGTFPGAPEKECLVDVPLSIGDWIEIQRSEKSQWCGTKKQMADKLTALIASGQPVLVPVVGPHTDDGTGQFEFQILSFKALTLLGFNIRGEEGGTDPYPGTKKNNSWLGTACESDASRSCLYGSFGPATIAGTPGDNPDFGVRAVSLIP